MKTLIAILIACLISTIPAQSHSDMSGVGITTGSSILFNDIGTGSSAELNLSMLLINIGGNIQLQDKISPKYNLYIGVGLANVLQLQFGTDWSDKKLRIQTLIPLFDGAFLGKNGLSSPKNEFWYKNINVHIFYENNYTYSKMSNFGFGIHYLVL